MPYLIPETLPLDKAFEMLTAHYRGNNIPAVVLKREDFDDIHKVEIDMGERIKKIMKLDESPELIQPWPMRFLWRGIRVTGKCTVIFYLLGDRVAKYTET